MHIAAKVDFKPISSRIIRRIFGYSGIENIASEQRIICESEERQLPPAIYLSGQLDKITGVHEFSAGLSDEIRKATCKKEFHTETIAYHLKNVCLVNGQLCSHSHYKKLTFNNIGLKPAIIRDVISDAALCSTAAGNDYFAHFLYDDACTSLMANQFSTPIFANTGQCRTKHMLEYLALFGIKNRDVHTAHFNNLWVFNDIALNSHRCNRLHQLRQKLTQKKNKNSERWHLYQTWK
jgi:sulfur relay (sulfurtransferase) DsrF/TusC family protein